MKRYLDCIISSSVPFSVTHDYGGSGTYLNETYQLIFDYQNNIDWVDTFYFPAVDPEAKTINTATFSITHIGNIDYQYRPELWLITDQVGQSVGHLSQSEWGSWTTDTFLLKESVIDTMMSSDPWSLEIRISEDTSCWDFLRVDKATLASDYTPVDSSPAPVPEPATMLLLGTGLAGMAAVGRRRKAKKD